MDFNKQLVLFSYLLRQFGYEDFESLRDAFSDKESGYDATGRSYFMNALIGNRQKSIDDATLQGYDDAIQSFY